MVDLKKAYDSVNREKLYHIMSDAVTNENEKVIVDFMKSLGMKTVLEYGDSNFVATKGVVQGGVLSPHLFNKYLDNAIQSNKVLE